MWNNITWEMGSNILSPLILRLLGGISGEELAYNFFVEKIKIKNLKKGGRTSSFRQLYYLFTLYSIPLIICNNTLGGAVTFVQH